MGLAEKRALKVFQEENFAKCVANVARIVGKPVNIVVDWEALNAKISPEKAHSYWDNTFFLPLVSALEQIAKDSVGRESMKEQLEQVRIKGATRHVFTVGWHRGMLAMDLQMLDDAPVGGPGTKTYKDRVAAIVGCIEENLT